MGPMKLTYFSASYLPSQYANSVHVMKMASAFAGNGCDVQLVGWRGSDESDGMYDYYGVKRDFGVTLMPNPGKGFSGRIRHFWYPAIQAWALGRSGASQVYGRNLVGLAFCAMRGLDVMVETHSPPDQLSRLERWAMKYLLRTPRLRGLVVISHALKSRWVEGGGLSSSRIMVAPDSADAIPEDLAPKRLGPPERLQIGYVGHLYAGRGVELVEALARTLPHMDFHIVGGRDEDIALWRQRTADLTNFTLHGFVAPSEADAFRLGCDVLLAPYSKKVTVLGKTDTTAWMSPLKLFEYMAAGRAMLCSDLPVLREVLRDGTNCRLLPPDDIQAWAGSLQSLADCPESRDALGQAAKEYFLANHTWHGRARSILDFIEANGKI